MGTKIGCCACWCSVLGVGIASGYLLAHAASTAVPREALATIAHMPLEVLRACCELRGGRGVHLRGGVGGVRPRGVR